MAVLITTEFPGLTQDMYNGLHAVLDQPARTSPGFLMHCAGPVDGGWQVTELWESQKDFDTFFTTYAVPLLPAGGALPATTVREIVSIVTP